MDFNKLKEAADFIIIPSDMKNRIKAHCQENKEVKKINITSKKAIAALCSVLLILFIIGFPYLTHNGEVRTTGFFIKAYALNDTVSGAETILSDQETKFEVSVYTRPSGLLSGIGGNELSDSIIFADIGFSCTGENIKTITYTMSDGFFVQDLILTPEQFNDDYMKSQNILCAGKDPDAVNFNAIKQIGKSVTILNNDPNINGNLKFPYTLALPCSSDFLMYDVTIKVILKYIDGSTKSQEVFVTQKTNEMNDMQALDIFLSLKD
ncbi:MAG: hypothetical protein ACYCWE_09260 [Eubacteriales bacterium]